MDFLFSVPYTVIILITLFIILGLNRLLNNLILAVLIGTTVLAFWIGLSPLKILTITWQRVSSINNIFLIIVVFQVIFLSSQLKETGIMRQMVNSVRARVSQRASMAVLPAVIGLLPMPGGALFSAPLVDDCDQEKVIPNLLKTKINYWFRHIWEYWWPLYPGVLLAIEITGVQDWQFILVNLPLSIFSVLGGAITLLFRIKNKKKTLSQLKEQRQTNFLFLVLPIIIIIAVYTILRIVTPVLLTVSKYLPMSLAILCAQIILQIQRPLKITKWYKILFSYKTLKLVIIVVLIRIYGAFIEAELSNGIPLMSMVRDELLFIKVPIILIIMIIPFISGLSTGLAIGFVGASFPIVVNLLGSGAGIETILSYSVVAYGFGYIGMMLSPVHICHVVTNTYFKTNLLKSIVQLFLPSAFVIIGSLFMHVILNTLFGLW